MYHAISADVKDIMSNNDEYKYYRLKLMVI